MHFLTIFGALAAAAQTGVRPGLLLLLLYKLHVSCLSALHTTSSSSCYPIKP
jgi:hypothetical protein